MFVCMYNTYVYSNYKFVLYMYCIMYVCMHACMYYATCILMKEEIRRFLDLALF